MKEQVKRMYYKLKSQVAKMKYQKTNFENGISTFQQVKAALLFDMRPDWDYFDKSWQLAIDDASSKNIEEKRLLLQKLGIEIERISSE